MIVDDFPHNFDAHLAGDFPSHGQTILKLNDVGQWELPTDFPTHFPTDPLLQKTGLQGSATPVKCLLLYKP